MLEKIDALSERFGRPETLLADNGYFSEANVMQCAAAKIEPLIATGRQPHHRSWRERFAALLPAPENRTPVEAMAWRLRTPHGKQLYGLRKRTPEPVFGIIKSVIGSIGCAQDDNRWSYAGDWVTGSIRRRGEPAILMTSIPFNRS